MNDNDKFLNDQGEVNLFLYWRIIKKRRKFIGIFVSAAVILTTLISFLLTNIYEARLKK